MKLSAIDLNLLLVLHAVLEEGSVTRAARRLHVTPPAISNALARLRSLLGDPLFVRTGQTLSPTPFTLQVAPGLAAAMGALEQVVTQGTAFDPATVVRDFTLACTDVDQLSLVPQVARAFAECLPRATLHVLSIDHLEAMDPGTRAGVDAVLAPAQPAPAGLHASALYEDEAVLVVRRGHPTVRRALTREQFNTLRHIDIRVALGERGIGNRAAEAYLQQHGLVRNVAATVPGFAAALMLAASTDFVAGVPRRLARVLAAVLPLQLVELPAPPLRFVMQLQWHERTHRDPGSRYFRDLLTRVARGTPPPAAPPRRR